MMRARLARLLRAIADRLAGQPEADALRLRVRQLEAQLAHARRMKLEADDAAERAYADRDRAHADAVSWLRVAGDQSEALIRLRDVASVGEVARPVFGRRRTVPHLRPVK